MNEQKELDVSSDKYESLLDGRSALSEEMPIDAFLATPRSSLECP